MTEITNELSLRNEAAQARQSASETRGYTINFKYLAIAFAGEAIIILTSLYGAYLFAYKYATGDWIDFHMMMLAPIGYAVIEMSRVPLAVAFRIQRSLFIKVLCFIGVIAAAGVTIKSMSQLGEIMFRPRLIQVNEANREYNEAVAGRNAFQKQYDLKKQAVDSANDKLAKAQDTNKAQAETLAAIAKPTVCPVYAVRNKKRVQVGTRACGPTAATQAVTEGVKTQNTAIQIASDEAKIAFEALTALGTAADKDAAVIRTQDTYTKAIQHSQLHAFTGMFFGKDPAQVTEGELSNFLRIFVFVPAICVSLAGTILAMASVNWIKPKKVKDSAVAAARGSRKVAPVAGGRYVLDPVHQTVVERTIATVIDDSDKEPETAHAATPTLKVA
jgi:hypothetical protein